MTKQESAACSVRSGKERETKSWKQRTALASQILVSRARVSERERYPKPGDYSLPTCRINIKVSPCLLRIATDGNTGPISENKRCFRSHVMLGLTDQNVSVTYANCPGLSCTLKVVISGYKLDLFGGSIVSKGTNAVSIPGPQIQLALPSEVLR